MLNRLAVTLLALSLPLMVGAGGLNYPGGLTTQSPAGCVRFDPSTNPVKFVSTGVSCNTANAAEVKAFSALGTPSDGTLYYCSNCNQATPCTGAGTGAFAQRINGAWQCAGGGGGGGGSSAFNDLTSGTNTTAAMTVGSGATLAVAGSGTITATDTVCTGCLTSTELDETTMGNTTFGAGSGFTWNFDTGTTDPTIQFSNGKLIILSGETLRGTDTTFNMLDATNTNGVSFDPGTTTFGAIGTGQNIATSTSCTGCIGDTQLASTAVTAGTCTNCDLTIDADGRVTSKGNGSTSSFDPTAHGDTTWGAGAPFTWTFDVDGASPDDDPQISMFGDELHFQNGNGSVYVAVDGDLEISSLICTACVDLTSQVSGTLPIASGGTGTGSTLTGLMRGSASAMTAAELSGDVSTSGSNVTAIGASKVTGTMIVNGTVDTADIASNAIDNSKVADGSLVYADLNTNITNPTGAALGDNVVYLGTNFVFFEGATSNTSEGFLTPADVTADRTWTLPDVTGTLITTGDTASVTNTMLAGSIDLTSKVTGVLPQANGGTGQTSLAAAVGFLAAGTSGTNQLISNGDALVIAAGSGITTTAGATDTVTIASTLGTSVDISSETNLTASGGVTLTGDNLTADLGTSVDISSETNLAVTAPIVLTGDTVSITNGDDDNTTKGAIALSDTNFDCTTGICDLSSNVITSGSTIQPSMLEYLAGDDSPRKWGADADVTEEWKNSLGQHRVTVKATPVTAATPAIRYDFPTGTSANTKMECWTILGAEVLCINGNGGITSGGAWIGSVAAIAGAMSIPTSTTAVLTNQGFISYDTDSVPPNIGVGTGSQALPLRNCPRQIIQASVNTAGTTYCLPGLNCNATSAAIMVAADLNLTFARLRVSLWEDQPAGGTATAAVTLQTAAASSCAASVDGNPNQCSFSDTALTCTITGGAGLSDLTCTDLTHSVQLTAGDFYRFKLVNGAGVSNPFPTISYQQCDDSSW